MNPLPQNVDFSLREVAEADQCFGVLGCPWEKCSEDECDKNSEKSFKLEVILERFFTHRLRVHSQ